MQKDSDGGERRPSEELISEPDPATEDGDTDASKITSVLSERKIHSSQVHCICITLNQHFPFSSACREPIRMLHRDGERH